MSRFFAMHAEYETSHSLELERECPACMPALQQRHALSKSESNAVYGDGHGSV